MTEKFTLIMNWGWYRHEDCRNAYSVHATECKVAQNLEKKVNQYKIQGYEENIASIEEAIEIAHFDATCRFSDSLKQFGFKHMIKICACAKTKVAK